MRTTVLCISTLSHLVVPVNLEGICINRYWLFFSRCYNFVEEHLSIGCCWASVVSECCLSYLNYQSFLQNVIIFYHVHTYVITHYSAHFFYSETASGIDSCRQLISGRGSMSINTENNWLMFITQLTNLTVSAQHVVLRHPQMAVCGRWFGKCTLSQATKFFGSNLFPNFWGQRLLRPLILRNS